MLGVLDRLCMRNLVGRKVGMMTCGMLGVMRREIGGVLHLDKYPPQKANGWGVGKRMKREKEKKNEERRKRTDLRFKR